MNILKVIFLIVCFFSANIFSKVFIFTYAFNRPDFIEMHDKTFKKFLKDDYEYIVFSDASRTAMASQIERMCNSLNIRCFGIPKRLHIKGTDPSRRHADGIQFSLRTLGYNHDDVVAIVDSDMFLIKPFSIKEYLGECELAGQIEEKGDSKISIRYLSPKLVFLNMGILPNKETISFEVGHIKGFACDSGAQTHYYLKNNPEIREKFFDVVHIDTLREHYDCKKCSDLTCSDCYQRLKEEERFNETQIEFIQICPQNIEFFLNHTFLHYCGGSNWNKKSAHYHTAKTRAFNNFFKVILS